jgi:hypothetical protein
MNERNSSLIFLLAALALVPLMPSGDSIWVDEAQTWRYARHATVTEVWTEFRNDKFSEAQMPLGMAAAWSWARILGTSEFSLRAPNMLYAIGAILCFYLIGRKEPIPLLPLFLAVQPYLWFYVNEARPYALQMFGGSLLLLSLYEVYRGNTSSLRWVVLWGLGALISSASSMLGAIPTFAFSAAIAAELIQRRLQPSSKQVLALAASILPLLVMAAYYLSALLAGAGGAKIWKVGPQNILFSAIEFLGFAGLLPPRHELRHIVRTGLNHPEELAGMWPFAIPASIMLVLLFAIGLYWIARIRQTPRWIFACAAVMATSAALLLAASMVVGFPFWGRHLAATFPAFVTTACWGASFAWSGHSLIARTSSAALVLMLLASSLMLRFSGMHSRDDYRSAATFAQRTFNEGCIVFWAANPDAARYYGLEVARELPGKRQASLPTQCYLVSNLSESQISLLPNPQVIILSKPDLYDATGALRQLIEQESYYLKEQLPSFEIFTAHWVSAPEKTN